MTTTVTIPDLAQLIKAGDLAEAKRQASTVLADADPHDLQVVAHCAHILETWPKIGVLKLRSYWQKSDEHDRVIIATCAPEQGQTPRTQSNDDPTPRWTARNKHEAPRDVRREIRPELCRPPRPTGNDSAEVTAYERERAGIDDAPPDVDQPDGYALDYDQAAVPPLRGIPCVRCWLERSAADQTRRHDDGLCTECRERGRPGIPSLPDNHTRTDRIEARCAFIADTYPHLAVSLLRRFWQQVTADDDRCTIALWVGAHQLTEPAPK